MIKLLKIQNYYIFFQNKKNLIIKNTNHYIHDILVNKTQGIVNADSSKTERKENNSCFSFENCKNNVADNSF